MMTTSRMGLDTMKLINPRTKGLYRPKVYPDAKSLCIAYHEHCSVFRQLKAIDLHLKHSGKDFWGHRFFDRAVRSYETSLIKHDGSIGEL